MTRKTRTFTDIDLTFKPHPVTGDIVKRYDDNAIKLSVINLIRTIKFERPFHPELSSKAGDLLFEPMSPEISTVISATIKEVIRNHEPRASVVSVNANPDFGENGYNVIIRLRIINQIEPLTVKTFLNRVK